MVDIHSHILYGIDDGCKDINESIKILKKYEQDGIKHVILTPHYINNGEYNTCNNEKIKLFNELNKKVKEENIKINIYLGNEIYITKDIISLLENNKIMGINNSKYLLIEFPIFDDNKQILNLIHNIVLSGYIPIIAHPERYIYVQKDINILNEYINLGALLQINKDSFFGKYGKGPKKAVKKIIKKQLATFIGTDIHSIDSEFYSNDKLKKTIKRFSNKKYAEELLELNGLKLLTKGDLN